MMMRSLKRKRLKEVILTQIRRLTTSNSGGGGHRRRIEDEGDWFYSSEWWDLDGSKSPVFRSSSDKGNGVVSVVASPSSTPNASHWYKTENWLNQRYEELHPSSEQNLGFRILGYQWRALRFNDYTRQSTVKVMAAYRESDPGSIFLRQEPHCLAVPYLKSMVSTGLASLSCNYDLLSSIRGKTTLKVLCVGHGGGSIPLFLASKIPGAIIDIVEIDPVVISASTQAMGFPSFSIMKQSGERALSKPNIIDEVLWKGVHERLCLYESDAEQFITESTDIYNVVFVDAYDGEDIFPDKLWNPDSIFLKALGERLHPKHGTVVVNLLADTDILDGFIPHGFIPLMGNYVSKVSTAYQKVLLDDIESICGSAFTVFVPWVCNTSLVVSRGFRNSTRDIILNDLISKSLEVENMLNLPFSCLEYVKTGLTFVD